MGNYKSFNTNSLYAREMFKLIQSKGSTNHSKITVRKHVLAFVLIKSGGLLSPCRLGRGKWTPACTAGQVQVGTPSAEGSWQELANTFSGFTPRSTAPGFAPVGSDVCGRACVSQRWESN